MARMSLWLRHRLSAFQRQHPEVNVHKGPHDMWHAEIPIEDGVYDSGYLHSPDLAGLLDHLEDILADGPRADSG